jgi:hypothetical protein
MYNGEHKKVERGDGKGYSKANPVWDILWKLQIPNKVKIFFWKALHGGPKIGSSRCSTYQSSPSKYNMSIGTKGYKITDI